MLFFNLMGALFAVPFFGVLFGLDSLGAPGFLAQIGAGAVVGALDYGLRRRHVGSESWYENMSPIWHVRGGGHLMFIPVWVLGIATVILSVAGWVSSTL